MDFYKLRDEVVRGMSMPRYVEWSNEMKSLGFTELDAVGDPDGSEGIIDEYTNFHTNQQIFIKRDLEHGRAQACRPPRNTRP